MRCLDSRGDAPVCSIIGCSMHTQPDAAWRAPPPHPPTPGPADKARLRIAPWDGYLKYYNLGEKVGNAGVRGRGVVVVAVWGGGVAGDPCYPRLQDKCVCKTSRFLLVPRPAPRSTPT